MPTQQNALFRKKTMERISSPENLTDYLKVTNPSIWIILVAIVLILVGLIAWSSVGVLETTADAMALVDDGEALVAIISTDGGEIEAGMTMQINAQEGEEYTIASVITDDYGRNLGVVNVDLPDGSYDAKVVTEQIHPIQFLFEGNK